MPKKTDTEKSTKTTAKAQENSPQARKCSFNPNDYMVTLEREGPNGTRISEKYLEVKYRVLWFQLYCQENGLSGVIDDSEVIYDPVSKMVIANCVVYIDGVVVGRSSSAKYHDLANPERGALVFPGAGTAAKGRALANAGFGTVNSGKEEGDTSPCDAGVQVVTEPNAKAEETAKPKSKSAQEPKPQKVKEPEAASEPAQPEEPKAEPDKKTEPEQAASEKTETNSKEVEATDSDDAQMKLDGVDDSSSPANEGANDSEIAAPETLEEALAVVVPIGRADILNKTLGEVMEIDPNVIRYYSSDRFVNPKLQYLKSAAQIILKAKS